MHAAADTIVELEKKFWQALVDQDTDVALDMLCEPAVLVNPHGTMKVDHAGYRRLAEDSGYVLQGYELGHFDVVFPNDSTAVITYRAKQRIAPTGDGRTDEQDMHDSSTWIRTGGGWKCAVHTQTPIADGPIGSG